MNTDRSSLGCWDRSGVGPENRTRPRSMKMARLEMAVATLTDCSTMTTVTPLAARARMTSRSWATTEGARPSDSSSISSRRGRQRSARARASICCSPPDSSPARWSSRSRRTGKSASTRSWAASANAGSLWWRRAVQAAIRRFSPTVSDGNTPRPPSTVTTPAWTRSAGLRRSMSVADEGHPSLRGPQQPGHRAEHGGLAGAVGPEEGHHLALPDPDLHVVEDHGVAGVPGVEAAELDQRRLPARGAGVGRGAPGGHLLAGQLLLLQGPDPQGGGMDVLGGVVGGAGRRHLVGRPRRGRAHPPSGCAGARAWPGTSRGPGRGDRPGPRGRRAAGCSRPAPVARSCQLVGQEVLDRLDVDGARARRR